MSNSRITRFGILFTVIALVVLFVYGASLIFGGSPELDGGDAAKSQYTHYLNHCDAVLTGASDTMAVYRCDMGNGDICYLADLYGGGGLSCNFTD